MQVNGQNKKCIKTSENECILIPLCIFLLLFVGLFISLLLLLLSFLCFFGKSWIEYVRDNTQHKKSMAKQDNSLSCAYYKCRLKQDRRHTLGDDIRSILVVWLDFRFLDTEVDDSNPGNSMLCP